VRGAAQDAPRIANTIPYLPTRVRVSHTCTRVSAANYQWWRFLTPCFLHGGLLHLFMNLFSQFRMGLALELAWGSDAWLAIYVASGLGGNALSCVASPGKTGVGASGALFGIMGAWLADVLCSWNSYDATTAAAGDDDPAQQGQDLLDAVEAQQQQQPYVEGESVHPGDQVTQASSLVQVLLNVTMGMVVSLAPIVDWAAHLGGFLTGALLGVLFRHRGAAVVPGGARDSSGSAVPLRAWLGARSRVALCCGAAALVGVIFLIVIAVFYVDIPPTPKPA
jgi:membrane associated rhomboid family serine protease